MSSYFGDIAHSPNPGPKELMRFLDETLLVLSLLVESDDFDKRLWRKDAHLRELAKRTLDKDVQPAVRQLKDAIAGLEPELLRRHGLVGDAARFKYAVLDKLARSWRRHKNQLTVGHAFRSLFEAIDALLDSLIAAAGGVGGLIKEFKDAVMALAPTR